MKGKYSLWRVALGLIVAGVVLLVVGYAMTGFNSAAYTPFAHQGYAVINFSPHG